MRNERPAWDTLERDEDDPLDPTLASTVCDLVDWLALRPDELTRIVDGRVFEDLYGGRWVDGDDLAPGVRAYAAVGGDPVKLNFARNAVDFVQTKIAGETPAVVVSSRGGGYSAERRAKRLSEYVDSLIDSAGLMSVMPKAALSALIRGSSVIKTVIDRTGNSPRPSIELVPAEQIHVDPIEAKDGKPRALYERRPIARASLLDLWVYDRSDEMSEENRDALEDLINGLPEATDPLGMGFQDTSESMSDEVDVYEAWTLGTVRRPGRHVVCVRGGVLLDEPWALPRFPHVIFGYDLPPVGRGLWAQGLLAQVDEAQAEIDFLLAQVSEQVRLARLKVFLPQNSGVSEDQLADSAQGTIIEYNGNREPSFVMPPTVSREAISHIQWLVQELYQTIGMSESGASSQRPAGVNSGRAILFFHDFQTKRFVDVVRRYGEAVTDVVERLLDRAEEVDATVGPDPEFDDDTSENGSIEERLSWSDVRMDRESFNLRIETISAVPRTYAGRIQRIEQLIAQGQMPEGYWTEYLSDPQVWRAESRAAAQAEYLEWLISQLTDVDADEPELLDKMDFGMAIEVLGDEVLSLTRRGAPQEVIDRVEDFYDSIVARRDELTRIAAERQGQLQAGPGQMAGGTVTPQQAELEKFGLGGT